VRCVECGLESGAQREAQRKSSEQLELARLLRERVASHLDRLTFRLGPTRRRQRLRLRLQLVRRRRQVRHRRLASRRVQVVRDRAGCQRVQGAPVDEIIVEYHRLAQDGQRGGEHGYDGKRGEEFHGFSWFWLVVSFSVDG
jgi:hypothetical protein